MTADGVGNRRRSLATGGFRKDSADLRVGLANVDGKAPLIEPYASSVQDRNPGAALLQVARRLFPFLRLGLADDGYNSKQVAGPTNFCVEIVSKIGGQFGFVVLPIR